MNKLGYILSGLSYFLLSLAYIFRGNIKIGTTSYKITHRHMQLIVSILYMTVGYIYIVDGVYDKFEDFFENNNNNNNNNHKDKEDKEKDKKTTKYMNILILYIILAIITFYIGKMIMDSEKDHDRH